jgi:hypothetical protein
MGSGSLFMSSSSVMHDAPSVGQGLAARVEVPPGLERVLVVKRCPESHWAIDEDMGYGNTICVLCVEEERGWNCMMFLKIAAQ